jgi:hypothetical protein
MIRAPLYVVCFDGCRLAVFRPHLVHAAEGLLAIPALQRELV